ncbi:hypothetical protein PMIN01_03291 [Paraphaeosphaeria minitans]|uniref:Uncharacterized protein n=1 Tax=Paraphaeosphaeria minitans TaxID=565426 RepID=A0A9P6KSN5_9PLEO|nr:hypothetical protein PMIN01_03291 [Paraphaeosphaeria minitans]
MTTSGPDGRGTKRRPSPLLHPGGLPWRLVSRHSAICGGALRHFCWGGGWWRRGGCRHGTKPRHSRRRTSDQTSIQDQRRATIKDMKTKSEDEVRKYEHADTELQPIARP